jgi:hypothetical protein
VAGTHVNCHYLQPFLITVNLEEKACTNSNNFLNSEISELESISFEESFKNSQHQRNNKRVQDLGNTSEKPGF